MGKSKRMTGPEVLAVAAVLLEDGPGWCQGEHTDHQTGAVCALGAIDLAVGMDAYYDPVSIRESCVGTELLRRGLGGRQVAGWNDSPKRTKRQVVQKLRRMAQRGW